MADTTDPVATHLAQVRERSERPVAHAGSLPITHPGVRGLMESAGDVPALVAALEAVLADHDNRGVFLGADDCDHPEPADDDDDAWPDWDADHPPGAGDVGRICLLTETGRYCPACTRLVYEDDDPVGDSYVDASNCIVRPIAAAKLLGSETAPAGEASRG